MIWAKTVTDKVDLTYDELFVSFLFLFLPGPGLPLYKLIDNRGPGVGLYTLKLTRFNVITKLFITNVCIIL